MRGTWVMTKKIVTQSKRRKHKVIGTVIKANGRTVGQVIGDVFVKDLSARNHFLRNPEAIAFSLDALHAAEDAGAEYCEVLDTDTGTKYKASISKIWDMGRDIDYGYGRQRYLTLSNWLQTRDPQHETQTDIPEYSASDTSCITLDYKSTAPVGITFTKGSKQLGLFGGDNE